MMTFLFQAIARAPAIGTDFARFFATGYLPLAAYQGMSTVMASAVKANKNLFSYPVVAPIDAVATRYILQLVTSLLVAMIIFAVCTSEPSHPNSMDPEVLVASFVVATMFGLGVGLINIPMFDNYPLYEQIFNLVNRPMFMISGVFFLPDSMPHPIQQVLMWNPLVHVIMWFRSGIYPEYRAIGLDLGYLGLTATTLVMIGLFLFTISLSLREDRL